jgi:hypothetical protein
MICSMFMGNLVETGWKLKKLKQIAHISDRREVSFIDMLK